VSRSGTVVKNTGAMLFGTIIRMSASFVLVVFIGRKLGPTGMGEFSLILTLFWVFQTMAGMGIQPLLIREVASNRENTGTILVNAALLSFLVSCLMSALMILFSAVMKYTSVVQTATLWMSTALILATVSLVFQSVFIAWEKAELVLIGMTWENIVRLLVGVFVLIRGGDIVAIAAVFAVAGMVNLGVNIGLMHRHITCLTLKIDPGVCFWLARLLPTFAGISIFSTLFWHMDILLLSRLVSMEALGYYSAPMRLVNVMKLVLQSYKVAIQPVAARLYRVSKTDFKEFCEKSLHYIFMFTIPVSIGGLILSDRLLLFIFGEAFAQSNLIFKIVIWILIPYGMILVFASFLIAAHFQRVDMRINLISMLIAYALGYSLISLYGILGAGVAVLLAVTVFMVQQLIFISRHLFQLNFWRLLNKLILSGLVMGIATWLLRGIHVLFCILAAMVIYFGLLAGLRVISLKDLSELRNLRES
jgi:O-antigen/teichoic acid export membrane protein